MNGTALIINKKYSGNFGRRKSLLMEDLENQLLKVSPVIIYQDGTKQICVNEISIKVRNENILDSLFKEYSYTKSNVEFEKNQFIIKIFDLNTEELFSLINNLQYEKDIVFAEPNFIRLLKPHTNDPQYNSQWSINNTGYLGGNIDADMDVDGAWVLGTGQNVTVAVIDEGVDLNHPDLTSNLIMGFDATGNNSNGAPNSFNDDGHGTSCAGIVAAEANNSEGIAGIAYNSKIMPIRIAFSNGLELGNPNRTWITTDNWIRNGINWAVSNGADVLSNSWGGGSPSVIITNAINNAVNNGRNGNGCTVLFSTGNSNTGVSYPATLPNVIAIGASSMCDERKSLTSCDGENFWGSNFGTNIDLVAPGVQIWTTDLTGNNGYSNNDYVSTFNGTSSACPNVAGVAAIVLSINPSMTQSEVRQIIETTVDKVSGYSYSNVSGQPNGTWNDQVGYGRVNALKAALKAYQLKVSGPNLFCTSSSFSVNIPSGATVNWSANPDFALSFTQGSSITTATRVGNFDGTVEINATISNNSESLVISKSVSIGIADVDLVTFTNGADSGDYFCTSHYGNTYHIQPGNVPNTTYQYRLRKYPNLNVVYTSPTGRSHSDEVYYIPSQGWYEFQVRATNDCGTGPWVGYEVEYVDCSQGGGGEYRISPNPTSSTLTIEKNKDGQIETSNLYDQDDQTTYQLYDFYANILTSGDIRDITTINVSNYKKGIYILKISFKDKSEIHKVIIE